MLFVFLSLQNQIKMIENLDSLMSLRFLTLAGNQIERIENINMLDQLMFLDLSENKIGSFDPGKVDRHFTTCFRVAASTENYINLINPLMITDYIYKSSL